MTSVPRNVTMTPDSPECTASTARRPNRMPSSGRTRSAVRLPGSPRNLLGQPGRHAVRHRNPVRERAFGDHDDRRAASVEAARHPGQHSVETAWVLRAEDHVRAAGQPGVQGQPAGILAGDLDDQRALVRFGGSATAVERVGGEFRCPGKGIRRAEHDERVEVVQRIARLDRAARRAEKGPVADFADLGRPDRHAPVLPQPGPAVLDAGDFPVVHVNAFAGESPEHRVRSGTAEVADPHAPSVARLNR